MTMVLLLQLQCCDGARSSSSSSSSSSDVEGIATSSLPLWPFVRAHAQLREQRQERKRGTDHEDVRMSPTFA